MHSIDNERLLPHSGDMGGRYRWGGLWAVALATLGLACASGAETGGGVGAAGGEGGTASCDAELATDPLNCGACGFDCLGGTCEAGFCSPVRFWTAPPTPDPSERLIHAVRRTARGVYVFEDSGNTPLLFLNDPYARLWRLAPRGEASELLLEGHSIWSWSDRTFLNADQGRVYAYSDNQGSPAALVYDEITGETDKFFHPGSTDRLREGVAHQGILLNLGLRIRGAHLYRTGSSGSSIRLVQLDDRYAGMSAPSADDDAFYFGARTNGVTLDDAGLEIVRVARPALEAFEGGGIRYSPYEIVTRWEDPAPLNFLVASLIDAGALYVFRTTGWNEESGAECQVGELDVATKAYAVLSVSRCPTRHSAVTHDAERLFWMGGDGVYALRKGGGEARRIVDAELDDHLGNLAIEHYEGTLMFTFGRELFAWALRSNDPRLGP